MKPCDSSDQAAGEPAFLPPTLPPPLAMDMELALALSRADAALSELSGLGGMLPSPHLLSAPFQRREAVLSCRIAGTRASLAELLVDELEYGADKPEDGGDIGAIRNHTRALEHGIAGLADAPLSWRLIREVHARLMAGIDGVAVPPGEFRRKPAHFGAAGKRSDAIVVPPPADMAPGMLAWEEFLSQHDALPDLIQCALMLAQFEALRPFADGNGRLGRLLVILFLTKRRRLARPMLCLSAFIDAHYSDYGALLQRVRSHGEWLEWIRFFLRGVTESADFASAQARELNQLRNRYRTQLRRMPDALALLDELFGNPYLTIARAARLLGKTPPIARTAVLKLEEQQVLREISGREWGRFYVCQTVLDTLEPPIA